MSRSPCNLERRSLEDALQEEEEEEEESAESQLVLLESKGQKSGARGCIVKSRKKSTFHLPDRAYSLHLHRISPITEQTSITDDQASWLGLSIQETRSPTDAHTSPTCLACNRAASSFMNPPTGSK